MKATRLAAGAFGMLLSLGVVWPAPAPGDSGVAHTVVSGTSVEEIPVTFLGTYRDFAGPGYDLHLVQLEGAIADRVGVASGMSGSPVYFDGELLGALSYRLGSLPTEAIAGVTPIEQMLDAAERRAPGPPANDAVARPISTPVHVGGLAPAVRRWLAPQLEELGLVAVAGGSGNAGKSSGSLPLRGGSPVGAELVRGDLSIGATGTVTLVEGDRVLAFGHPFLGAGEVEVPMVSAEVIHTLADQAGSFKLSNTGEEIGAIVGDRLSAVVGRFGVQARMIPVALDVRGGGYDRVFRFEVARSQRLTPLLTAVTVANALISHNGYEQEVTLLVSGRIRFEGRPELEFESALAAGVAGDPTLATAGVLQQALGGVWGNPYEDPRIRSIEVRVEVTPGIRRYEVQSLHFDRRPVRPGEPFDVDVVLRPFRGESVRRRLTLSVPPDLEPGSRVMLVVGPPSRVQRAMGAPLARRLRSSEDVNAYIRAASEYRSASHLTAAIYRGDHGVVTRGEAYPSLPPTAERLLASGQGTVLGHRIRALALVDSALDGPVTGGKVLALEVGRPNTERQ